MLNTETLSRSRMSTDVPLDDVRNIIFVAAPRNESTYCRVVCPIHIAYLKQKFRCDNNMNNKAPVSRAERGGTKQTSFTDNDISD